MGTGTLERSIPFGLQFLGNTRPFALGTPRASDTNMLFVPTAGRADAPSVAPGAGPGVAPGVAPGGTHGGAPGFNAVHPNALICSIAFFSLSGVATGVNEKSAVGKTVFC